MQPYLFPYLGYWQLIHSVDQFVIFDDVNYINKGYINRNSILLNGKAHRFTLELLDSSQNKKINDILVGSNQIKILKTISSAYLKAPFYQQVFPLLEEILLNPEKNLAKFIGNSIQLICAYLGIQSKILYSSEIHGQAPNLKSTNRILDLLRILQANEYINAIGGQALYNKSDFLEKNVKLLFIKSEYQTYKQFENDFVPHLSIIDVLMFNNIDQIKTLLSECAYI